MERNYQKITCQEWGFLNFLRPLTATGLPLMENVLTPIAKSVLVPLGSTAAATTKELFKKKSLDWDDCNDNLKWRNKRYYEKSYISRTI